MSPKVEIFCLIFILDGMSMIDHTHLCVVLGNCNGYLFSELGIRRRCSRENISVSVCSTMDSFDKLHL